MTIPTVNKKRIESKIPELLSEGSTTDPANMSKYVNNRRKLIKRKNEPRIKGILNTIVTSLEHLERDLQTEWEFYNPDKKKKR